MNAFINPDAPSATILQRQYEFDQDSLYQALDAHSEQIQAIQAFRAKFGSEMYYLFYNPSRLPVTIAHPLATRVELESPPEIGCRVHASRSVHDVLAPLEKGRTPKYRMLSEAHDPVGGYRLEHWAADLLLTCQVGRQYDGADDAYVSSLMTRRSGPIGAAISVQIILP